MSELPPYKRSIASKLPFQQGERKYSDGVDTSLIYSNHDRRRLFCRGHEDMITENIIRHTKYNGRDNLLCVCWLGLDTRLHEGAQVKSAI
jgi:hypothetical protein